MPKPVTKERFLRATEQEPNTYRNGWGVGEGLNLEEQRGAAKLDTAMNPDGGAKLSALNYVTSSGYHSLMMSNPLRGSALCGPACRVVCSYDGLQEI